MLKLAHTNQVEGLRFAIHNSWSSSCDGKHACGGIHLLAQGQSYEKKSLTQEPWLIKLHFVAERKKEVVCSF
jgi:hypothetical protein